MVYRASDKSRYKVRKTYGGGGGNRGKFNQEVGWGCIIEQNHCSICVNDVILKINQTFLTPPPPLHLPLASMYMQINIRGIYTPAPFLKAELFNLQLS